jgi:hypothetical protein
MFVDIVKKRFNLINIIYLSNMEEKIKKFKHIIAQEHLHWWQYKNKYWQGWLLDTNFLSKFKDRNTRFVYRWIRFKFNPKIYYNNKGGALCGKLYILLRKNNERLGLSLSKKRKCSVDTLLSFKKLKIKE